MLTIASRLDMMNRLGRTMADPTRSRILMTLLEGPGYPAGPSSDLGLSRSNVSNVSNDLTCVRECGLVGSRTQGRASMFSLENPQFSLELREDANHFIGTSTDNELGTNGFTEVHGSAPAQKGANR